MACSNCLGAGLKLDGDGNPALNPDPTGGLAVSAATCLASVKTRRPFGLGTKEQPSGAGCGQGLHIDSGGTLWASQPGYHTQSGGHLHAVANALPVGMGHEAVERSEAALAHHDDVTLLAGADRDPGQRRRAGQFGLERLALEQQRAQTATAVRVDQSHAEPPQNMVFREGRRLTNPLYPPMRLFLFGDKGLLIVPAGRAIWALW